MLCDSAGKILASQARERGSIPRQSTPMYVFWDLHGEISEYKEISKHKEIYDSKFSGTYVNIQRKLKGLREERVPSGLYSPYELYKLSRLSFRRN